MPLNSARQDMSTSVALSDEQGLPASYFCSAMPDSDDEQLGGEWQIGGELDPSDFTDNVAEANAIGPLCCGDTFSYDAGQQSITVHQDSEKGLSFQIWPSSTFLADYAVSRHTQTPGCWKGVRVLELGCGCGLVGLVWATLGADVLLTDLASVLGLMQQNIDHNSGAIAGGGGTATAAACPWGEPLGTTLEAWATPDIIVASDVVYHRELFDLLLTTLGALGRPGTRLLLAHVRRWKTDKRFFTALRRLYHVKDVTGELDPASAALSSHTKGARRLFSCLKK